jgi:hypothetical protein
LRLCWTIFDRFRAIIAIKKRAQTQSKVAANLDINGLLFKRSVNSAMIKIQINSPHCHCATATTVMNYRLPTYQNDRSNATNPLRALPPNHRHCHSHCHPYSQPPPPSHARFPLLPPLRVAAPAAPAAAEPGAVGRQRAQDRDCGRWQVAGGTQKGWQWHSEWQWVRGSACIGCAGSTRSF